MAVVSLDEQRVSFEGFLGLAHAMGAGPLRDADARILGEGDRQVVVLFFSHADFPSARFGYRARTPGEDRHEGVWLAEELATGRLHRLLRDNGPTTDDEGVTWLHLHGQVLRLGAGR